MSGEVRSGRVEVLGHAVHTDRRLMTDPYLPGETVHAPATDVPGVPQPVGPGNYPSWSLLATVAPLCLFMNALQVVGNSRTAAWAATEQTCYFVPRPYAPDNPPVDCVDCLAWRHA